MDSRDINFNKSIIKYFMDFLETDFHKRKSPKRKIQYTDSNNLVVGCNLKKYSKFELKMNKLLSESFKINNFHVKKGEYVATPNEKILARLSDKISEIGNERLKEINKIFISDFSKLLKDKNVSNTILLDDSVNNLIRLIETLIINQYIDDSIALFTQIGIQEQEVDTLKESLVNCIIIFFKDRISDTIEKIKTGENIDVKEEIDFITADNLKKLVKEYFSNYNVSDLFLEISKMNASKKILDKQEFYFSFFDITYEKEKYPVFYIPFEIVENSESNSFDINFDAQIYINKKCIEFIAQELKNKMNLAGKIDSINERIIYLSDIEDLNKFILHILNNITNYFKIKDEINLNTNDKETIKNDFISISNSYYLNIFDKSDDALVNDYEELLQMLNDENVEIGEEFNEIINGFMTNEPKNFNESIETAWEEKDLSEKLVFEAPIPLNSEQIQILHALDKDDCKYVAIQGPPGTGKSHTITAILFNMILQNKSVLVLSDKKEALDVVEEKITTTLNKVRKEDNFQNPILRLGKTGNNYGGILAQTSLDKIKIYNKIVKNKIDEIEEKIKQYSNTIKEDINFEKLAYGKIKLEDILELENLETKTDEFNLKFNLNELIKYSESIEEIFEVLEAINKIKEIENYKIIDSYSNLYGYKIDDRYSYDDIIKVCEITNAFEKAIKYQKSNFTNLENILNIYEDLSCIKIEELRKLLNHYEEQSKKIFGFLFNRSKLLELSITLKNIFPKIESNTIKDEIENIRCLLKIDDYLKKQITVIDENLIEIFQKIVISTEKYNKFLELSTFTDALIWLKEKSKKFISNFSKLKFNDLLNIDVEYSNRTEEDYANIVRYILLKGTITADFSDLTISKYVPYKTSLENLVTLKTTHVLDGRVINFYENNQATAKLLRGIIKKKQKFPKAEFAKLKDAFPCILAGIRDYAEYIPLESGIFDLVIIDEASQVSIAQALPALLRAKKVLVLGDKQQFSNVKSNQAKTDINAEYLSMINDSYRQTSFYNSSYHLKLDKFNIKSSILEFFEYISNYNTMLYKYFRGYKEIISYSNKNFYGNHLQVMKIRGKSIDDVIKFSYIEHDGKFEVTPKTNALEVKYIINELIKIINSKEKVSIGIITPHTNQQKLLLNEIDKLSDRNYLYDNLNLKVMTFDTCQGEERDIIFYSMVANPAADSLWGVFAKDFGSLDLEEEGKIRAQRLNVGFSRAKECMHFVVSKPLEDFTGEIGKALRHYNNIIETAKKEKSVNEVDSNSQMEPQVLTWFYQTDFWLTNNQYIEFLPQFELGKYLKQLDNSYNHPSYCVDFLMMYRKEKEIKIIIEYDGFKEHFQDLMKVSASNYNDYYKEEDIYRQKVLESYGYKFLRINKFNVGDNPVLTLNNRINELLNETQKYEETFEDKIKNVARDLQNGNKKECPKCERILNLSDFKDNSLLTGFGRICNECKSKFNVVSESQKREYNAYECPKCGSRMVKRNGKYGSFFGCSKFPYCNYTWKSK